MLVIPKLEIRAGVVVHTQIRGVRSSDDLVAAARGWAAEGYGRLQLVDADALGGRRPNYSLVETLAHDSGLEIDLAAAADSADRIAEWMDLGATRVLLGARALSDEDWLRTTSDAFPGTLMVETGVRERRVTTRGWVRSVSIDLLDLIEDLAGVPLAALIVTAPPGTAHPPELALLEDVADASPFPILIEDSGPTMSALRAFEHRGVAGVIVPATALATALDPRAVANEFAR
jgi:phosphoribosylformimino-5-aminoimidazole carboxamide ribotide isomerase